MIDKKLSVLHSKKTFEIVFILTILTLFLLFLSTLIISHGQQQRTILFTDKDDYFMDFYNNLKYVSERDPYNNTYLDYREKLYPPLSYLVIYPFTKVFDYINNLPKQARTDQLGIMSVMLMFIFCTFILAAVLYEAQQGSKIKKWVKILCLFLSGIYIFSIERGNIVLISAIFVAIFLVYYKSTNKILREIALISLALAAGLKYYPAIFGLLLIYDKRFKDIVKISIYGLISIFLPFLFFNNGFLNIPYMIRNIGLNSQSYGYFLTDYRFGYYPLAINYSKLFQRDVKNLVNLSMIVSIIYLIIVIFSSYCLKKRWKTILLISCSILITPLISMYYCGLYLFVPIILFLNDEEHDLFDWVYLIGIIIILNPYQIIIKGNNYTQLISNVSLILIYTILCVESITLMIGKISGYFAKKQLIGK